MKFHCISPDAHGRIDGTVQANLLRHLPSQTGLAEADVIVIPISFYDDYQFRRDLPSMIGRRRWVLVDYLELGLDWNVLSGVDSHVLGRNSANFPRVSGREWMLLDAFVRDHPPVVYFKRELLEREVSEWLRPLDFPCYLDIPAIQSESEFNARPLDVFFFWGLSHEARPRLHGDIFRNAYRCGYEVLSQFGHWHGFFSDRRERTWATVHAPHFDRKPITDIMHFNHRSKLSVSLPGAGVHCFRDQEAPIGAIPCYWDCKIARAFPWIDGVNSIHLRPGNEWDSLYEATQRRDLYPIYVEAQRNIHNYTSGNYVNNHILASIEKRI